MPDSFPALAVLVLALLPGALYVWSFERQVGPWGVGLSDRVLQFIGASAILHAMAAPLTFWLYRTHLQPGLSTQQIPLLLRLAPVAYVGVPIGLGSLIGIGVRRQWRWVELVTGRDPAPRAWDYLFGKRPDGWVLLMLKSGTWLGGAYAETESGWRSYVSGYPEPQDIFLVESVEVDRKPASSSSTTTANPCEEGPVSWSGGMRWNILSSSMREMTMADKRRVRRPTRGGYEAGPKLVSELIPPPKRPGAGAKPASDSKK